MTMLRSIVMAFSMFSRIPTPRVEWKDANMRYITAAMPLIGVLIGLLLWAWTGLCELLAFGQGLFAAGMTLIPVAVTGGIHLDGLTDTVDALASHAPAEKKREILKDPNAGAFAVIGVVSYLLLYFAFCTELAPVGRTALWLGLILTAGRALGGLSVVLFPNSGSPGLLSTFKAAADKTATGILIAVFVLCAAGMLVLSPLVGLVLVLAALLCLGYVYRMSKKQFGGMSGDLAGYLIQISEIVMLGTLILMQKVDTL